MYNKSPGHETTLYTRSPIQLATRHKEVEEEETQIMEILVAYRLTKRADRHLIVTQNYMDVLDYVGKPEYRVFAYKLDPSTGRGMKHNLDPEQLEEATQRRIAIQREKEEQERLEKKEQERWLASDEYKAFLRDRALERRRAEQERLVESARRRVMESERDIQKAEADLETERHYIVAGQTDEYYEAKKPASLRRIHYYEEKLLHIRKEHELCLQALETEMEKMSEYNGDIKTSA